MSRIIDNFVRVYTPRYIALNIGVAVAYYLVINYLVLIQEKGIPIINVPQYLIYALVAVSSILLTVSINSIANNMLVRRSLGTGVLGTASTLLGGVVVGCGCSFSLLVVALGGLGASISTTIAVVDFLSSYGSYIMAALIALNVLLILFSVTRGHPARKRYKAKGR
ncbi:MAG: hypothetical protein KGH98_00695 [Candidatus Micrarchaeota archaeon]|nr:hypothetical protein [Candidatus Micrarchaeota archaeon]